jgi:hypothetical protein
MLAFNCVGLTNVVALGCPEKKTVDAGTKFTPLTSKVNGASVATDPGGTRDEIMGTGFCTVAGPVAITSWPPLLAI